MNAFICAVSKMKDTYISKEFKYFDKDDTRHLYIKAITGCPVCGANWGRHTVSGTLMFHTYKCGYTVAVDKHIVKIGRKSAYIVRAVSVFHPGPIPDENEDTI